MRAFLSLLVVAVMATVAFAVSELHALKHTTSVAEVAVAAEPETPTVAALPLARPVAKELSTWKGALPFGGVAGNDDEQDSQGDVLDEVDRCPDDADDNKGDIDGCPDIVEPPHKIIVTIDNGPEGAVITREIEVSSRIRILKLEQIIY